VNPFASGTILAQMVAAPQAARGGAGRPPASPGMWIEAFTQAKDPADPGANEDQFLVLPGLGYAVVDGVSDVEGR
jgi:hypothetical protein